MVPLISMAVVAALAAVGSGAPAAPVLHDGAGDDLRTVKARLIASALGSEVGDCCDVTHCTSTGPADRAAAVRDANALTAAGSWPDVNYTDTTRTGSWSPHVHLDRMVNMAATVRITNDTGEIPGPAAAAAMDYPPPEVLRCEGQHAEHLLPPSRLIPQPLPRSAGGADPAGDRILSPD